MLSVGWPVLALLCVFLAGGSTREAVSAEMRHPQALNTVQALDYAIPAGGGFIVKLVFRHGLKKPPPAIVNYHPKASIVLDFADTDSALGKDPVEVRQRELRSLQVLQAGARTRLVIELASPVVHEIALKGNELWITLRRPDAGVSRDAGGRFSEAASDAPRHGLREVAFQRGESGQGRIIVELSNSATPVDIRHQGKTLIVDFLDSSLPPGLERRLDVQDFGTPIKAIETVRRGSRVQMKIELEGATEYTAYQVGRHFVVSLQTGER